MKKQILLAVVITSLLLIATFAFASSYENVKSDSITSYPIKEYKQTDAEDKEPKVSGGGFAAPLLVKLSLKPETQYTGDGNAVYTLKIKDLHNFDDEETFTGPGSQEDGANSTATSNIKLTYNYVLTFNSEQNILPSWQSITVSLSPGEDKEINLAVKAENPGTYIFTIKAEGEGSNLAKGVLIYAQAATDSALTDSDASLRRAYFSGKGFAITPDSSQGNLVSLNLLKDNSIIKGKMNFANENYKIEGSSPNGKISFSLTNPKGEQEGTFTGTVREFNNFILIQGEIEFTKVTDELPAVWKLTAFAKREDSVFKKVLPTEGSVTLEEVKLKEIIEIAPATDSETALPTKKAQANESLASASQAIYIHPIKVKKELFGIPNKWIGEKVVELEIISGDKVAKRTIKAFSKEKAEGYEIGVGSLENENSLEISVERVATN